MEKIAIPVNANGCLEPHFGHCPQFLFANISNNKVEYTEIVDAPPHEPGLLPKWMAEHSVATVLAGGIGQRAIDLFDKRNIKVYIGAPQIDVNELLNEYLSGELKFTSNLCDH